MWTVARRSPHDREIARLAVPALGALAAEPLYLLADTAIVGHLGTNPLAGLAIAGTVLTAAFSVFNFLAYSTTAAVARQVGAGNRRAATEFGIDGCWLAAGLGIVLSVVILALSPAIVDAMGASDAVRPFAVTYLRISILGAPAMLLTATAIAARFGDDDVAAHQVAMQILLFLALSLDALAIAAQAMVGRYLGADAAHDARASARRLLEWGLVAGVSVGILVAATRPWLAALFTGDDEVRSLVEQLLWFVAALQPAAAIVFVLDGVLIGAGDASYLAIAMLAATLGVYLPAALAVAALDAGLLWLWGAIALWMVARLVGMTARYLTDRWQVTGALRVT